MACRLIGALAWMPAAGHAASCQGSYGQHVASHETGGCQGTQNCQARNPNSSAIGCHQLTNAALQDIGWKDRAGNWLPNPYSIYSDREFTTSMQAQNAALDHYTALNWSRISDSTKSVIGTEHSGIRLTEGGLLSAAHFLGPAGLNEFVGCGMRIDCISDEAAAANGGRQRAWEIAMQRLASGSAVDVSAYTGFHTPYGGGQWTGGPGGTDPGQSRGAFLPWAALQSVEVPPHQGERASLR